MPPNRLKVCPRGAVAAGRKHQGSPNDKLRKDAAGHVLQGRIYDCARLATVKVESSESRIPMAAPEFWA